MLVSAARLGHSATGLNMTLTENPASIIATMFRGGPEIAWE
jgi:hypothetical protein